jgi:hypothetical protein
VRLAARHIYFNRYHNIPVDYRSRRDNLRYNIHTLFTYFNGIFMFSLPNGWYSLCDSGIHRHIKGDSTPMPITINNNKYYHTAEACTIAGISKNTFLRWVAEGTFCEVQYRDGRGWRLFDDRELNLLVNEVSRRNSVNLHTNLLTKSNNENNRSRG